MIPPLAKLRPSREQITKVARVYATHRPLVQRTLTTGFVLYVLLTTYNGLFGRAGSAGAASSRKEKGKAKAGGETDPKKPPRFAVRISSFRMATPVHNCAACVGGRCVLPATIDDTPDCDPQYPLEGGTAPVHAFEPSHIPHSDIVVCRSIRREVRLLHNASSRSSGLILRPAESSRPLYAHSPCSSS